MSKNGMLEMLKTLHEEIREEKEFSIQEIREAIKPLCEKREFAAGTVVVAESKALGLKWPKQGDWAVIVSQDPSRISNPGNDGSPRSAGEIADTLIAIPLPSHEGFCVFTSWSGYFREATPGEIEQLEAKQASGSEDDSTN